MIQNILKTSIYKGKIEEPILNKSIMTMVNDCIHTKNFRIESNQGGLQTNKYDAKVNEKLSIKILEECAKYIDSLQKKKQFKITLNGFWINVNMKNHFNIEHMHYNYQNKFSGIWYVQCGKGSGNLVFKGRDDFVPVSQLDQYFDDDFTNEYEIEPEPNDFILFPSYLKHWVKPNLTETPRISVAFDIGFIDV